MAGGNNDSGMSERMLLATGGGSVADTTTAACAVWIVEIVDGGASVDVGVKGLVCSICGSEAAGVVAADESVVA